MEMRKLEIAKRASMKLLAQAMWYREHCGGAFVSTLMETIFDDLDALCQTPTIGRVYTIKGKHDYRSFVSRRKCIIKYWYTGKSLYVVDFVFTNVNY